MTTMTTHVELVAPSELGACGEYDNHAKVVRFRDAQSKLCGFIAIHRERGTLSTGGTRFFPYAGEKNALEDVLRLSRAMTAKCVVAGLPYGGAKAVIIGDPKRDKTAALLDAYARVVDSLSGSFRTGEDVGMTEEDVQFLLDRSKYFNGRSGVAGDPSPYAAESVHAVMRAIVALHLGHGDRSPIHVTVRGVGKVGGALAQRLYEDGCIVAVSDINDKLSHELNERYPGIRVLPNDEAPYGMMDVYAPCALGAEITDDNWGRFKAKIICGGANNQLTSPELAQSLESRNVLYVPDYLANAGGLINVSDELEPDGYHKERVSRRIESLARLARDLYRDSRARNATLSTVVDEYVHAHS